MHTLARVNETCIFLNDFDKCLFIIKFALIFGICTTSCFDAYGSFNIAFLTAFLSFYFRQTLLIKDLTLVALKDLKKSDFYICIGIVLGNKSIASTLISKFFNWLNLHELYWFCRLFLAIIKVASRRNTNKVYFYGIILCSELWPTLILLRKLIKVSSNFCLITSVCCGINNSDNKLKKYLNVLLYFSMS